MGRGLVNEERRGTLFESAILGIRSGAVGRDSMATMLVTLPHVHGACQHKC